MNPFEFVIAAIFLTGVFSLIRYRMGVPHRSTRDVAGEPPADAREASRLREEVGELKERIKVLDRDPLEHFDALLQLADFLAQS